MVQLKKIGLYLKGKPKHNNIMEDVQTYQILPIHIIKLTHF